jgi:hypothetical protein
VCRVTRRTLLMRLFRPAVAFASALATLAIVHRGSAQAPTLGAPPPEAKPLVERPRAPGEAPKFEHKTDGASITLATGGQGSTGNSRLFALSANGAFETRYNDNGFGISVLGNYGRSAPQGQPVQTTTENLQGRARYDRYIVEKASFFLISTGRHDRLQGVDFRLNLDPGFKYLFLAEKADAIWGEAGYDFQYDVRRDDALVDPTGARPPLDKTAIDHSTRAFIGARFAFNEQVTLSSGLEYLQSLEESSRHRLNFDALFAAKVGAGLAVGLGFGLRFDRVPLPGKEPLDTSASVSLVYSYSQTKEAGASSSSTVGPPPPVGPPPGTPPLPMPAPAPPPAPPPPASTAPPAMCLPNLEAAPPRTIGPLAPPGKVPRP